jgi:hypothetical protein
MATHVLGLFGGPDRALAAAGKLQDAGLNTPDLMSPIPLEGVEDVLGPKKTGIKRFTLFGACFGGLAGFALAAGTSVLYVHPTAGRPIITIPPFLIITYEMTILFGILATVLGFFISAKLPAIRERLYVPATSVDKFAVTVLCDADDQSRRAEEILHGAGAEEVLVVREDDV